MDKIQEIYDALDKWGIYPEDISELDGAIHITLIGDWKHTHTASDSVLTELGYTFKYAKTIPENPDEISDWYKAVRVYTK